jgi:hypothetical protein
MSLFEYFVKGLSLYLEARIWIRIRINKNPNPHQIKIRIRIRNNVMRITTMICNYSVDEGDL